MAPHVALLQGWIAFAGDAHNAIEKFMEKSSISQYYSLSQREGNYREIRKKSNKIIELLMLIQVKMIHITLRKRVPYRPVAFPT